MFSYTKLIDSHNLQLKKTVYFSVNYTYLIPNPPPSQVGKYSDTLVMTAGRRSGKIKMFGQLYLKEAIDIKTAKAIAIGPDRDRALSLLDRQNFSINRQLLQKSRTSLNLSKFSANVYFNYK